MLRNWKGWLSTFFSAYGTEVQHCWQNHPVDRISHGHLGISSELWQREERAHTFSGTNLFCQAKHLKNHPAFQKLNLACTPNSTAMGHFGKITVYPSSLCSLLLETLRKKEKIKFVLSLSSQTKIIQGIGVDFLGSQEAALTDTIPYKYHTWILRTLTWATAFVLISELT